MFTGIIKELGIVRGINKKSGLYRLEVEAKDIIKSANTGDSIAVNGVCLTVVAKSKDRLLFDVTPETSKKTGIINLKEKDVVNLEDALKAGEPLGGHFVSGHIDCVGKIKHVRKIGGNISMEIGFPDEFSDLIVERGSAAIDGISLTVGEAGKDAFNVHLIPHTLNVTNLGGKLAGDGVNIEFDIIGKYIKRISESKIRSGLTEEFLREKGF